MVYTDGLLEAYGPAGGLDVADIASAVRVGELSRLRDRVNDRGDLPLRDDIAALLVRNYVNR